MLLAQSILMLCVLICRHWYFDADILILLRNTRSHAAWPYSLAASASLPLHADFISFSYYIIYGKHYSRCRPYAFSVTRIAAAATGYLCRRFAEISTIFASAFFSEASDTDYVPPRRRASHKGAVMQIRACQMAWFYDDKHLIWWCKKVWFRWG